ncbi:sulfide:quinone oxidoreductase, mitochondrial [Anoplophora glabripennis]|uniref:sulfide:quinone oxidoreductase, mitochondrial n=1 Tax=Anoplophora glabripennis TaxID=217634 RepID=UPI000873E9D9|nr:sulfide:quinone oxidoreductase, mitochondrial [Anoplophora glabripennis]
MFLNKCIDKTLATLNRRCLSKTPINFESLSCKLLVVGGGTGGCSVAAKFSRHLKKNNLIVLDPSKNHYYQPLFTLIGAGAEKLENARRDMKDVLPQECTWIEDEAIEYEPKKNTVRTSKGHVIEYDYLLVAVGLDLRFDKIPGLLAALSKPGGVCSNYSPKYVNRTYQALQKLQSGNAIFTFPNSPVKCPGAPQKICYLTDHYLRKRGKRNNVSISYNTSLAVIFGVKKYADALWKICKERNIQVNLRTNLIKVNPDRPEATFENLDKPEEKFTTEFSMLHVTPPMATPETLSKNKDITNETGFVEVDKNTMQHVRFPNIFTIGDCSSSPNSKTAAAAAAQSEVVYKNMLSVMKNKPIHEMYDGYASCPLVTGYNKCILAEFDYDLNPLETFPFSQDKELYSMYVLKKNVIPSIYWHLMMNGHWNGPATFRKLMHLGFTDKKSNLHV